MWREEGRTLWLNSTSPVGAKAGLLVQHDAQERSVDLKSAVVLNETQLSEFVHEKLTRGCVVPIISANVSCDI